MLLKGIGFQSVYLVIKCVIVITKAATRFLSFVAIDDQGSLLSSNVYRIVSDAAFHSGIS